MIIATNSEAETERVGERIGAALAPGAVVGLIGPLGAGKTVLVRGIGRACGVDENTVRSPTFLTAAEYAGRLPFAHLDLYRHGDVSPDPDWMAELLDRDGVAVVEWFEFLDGASTLDALVITIRPGPAPDQRRLEVAAQGPRSTRLLAALASLEQAA